MVLVQMRFQVVAHRNLGRSYKPELDVLELAEQVGQRAHGPAVGQVADHRHTDAVDLAELVTDRVEVQQRLRRVLARAVTRVDDWHRAHRCSALGGAFLFMPHHNDVGVSADDADRVLERLALRRG